MVTTSNGAKQHEIHPGGAKRLSQLVDDYVLTMQHAIRQNLRSDLEQRAKDEAGVLPEFTAVEMFDYLADIDDEFYNWCFPFCAIKLTKSNLGYLHSRLLSDFRRSLEPVQTSEQ